MSVSCLERALKKTLSVTYSVYLNKVRIARAMQMLEEGVELSISAIAFACGFSNQYHFARMFRKMTQACPRAFKKAVIEKETLSLSPPITYFHTSVHSIPNIHRSLSVATILDGLCTN
jgi:AraC-like DNA-binding protein